MNTSQSSTELMNQLRSLLSGQLVRDVHEFDGHIACDVSSRSEIVIPLIRDGKVLGVLDLDSPSVGRFDANDQALLSEIAQIYLSSIR